jgi:tetratricopeptide (TPR) repeat protein
MYVFITREAERTAKSAGLKEPVQKIVESLCEPDARIADRFKPLSHNAYWKKRIGSHRAIAKVCSIDGEQVVCLLDVLPRDIAYDDFPSGVEQLVPSASVLRDWLASQRSEKVVASSREVLPENLLNWLEPPRWDLQDLQKEVVVYETEEWVRRFRQPKIRDYWQTFGKLVTDACNCRTGKRSLSDSDCHISFQRLHTSDQPSRDVLILLGVDKTASNPDLTVSPFLEAILDDEVQTDDLIGFASRCYPAYLLADADSWKQIEFNDEANLALSAEEEAMLEVASRADKSATLPIFINGRAGSGKSTMLGYLFADYCERYLRQLSSGLPQAPRPVFLAYNERLLDVVKKGVFSLLTSHHRFLTGKSSDYDLNLLSDCFLPFQQYVLGCLSPEDRASFAPDKYISFYRFKHLYLKEPGADPSLSLKLPAASEFSPELCWYVIRTFIKGSGDEDLLGPDDYLSLPKKDRIVSLEQYKSIYRTIWEQWYKNFLEGGYWDDQDLVRLAISKNRITPQFAAIFCDEAQDFTRLELKMLMQLSILSQYSLEGLNVQSLPFAFAGDPFQTLNPTGFRSSSLTSTFHDEIIKAMDPTGEHKIEMNVFELTCNYRSDVGIVKATNLIQLWRRVLFGLELKPQRWLERGDLPEPTKFVIGRNITTAELKALVTNLNTIIILPCEEDQVLSFISEDDAMAGIVNNKTEVPANVFSAMSIKGLEFPRVVLYKFGESCDPSVWKRAEDSNDTLKHEYYFNKLYVAATRPKHSLFIVDTENGERALWHLASSLNQVNEFLDRLDKATDRAEWAKHVAPIQDGIPDTAADLKGENSEAIAQELFTKGRVQQNPELLRRAKRFYLSLGQEHAAELSEAYALQFEQRFKAAGDLFLKCEDRRLATESYWSAESWADVHHCCEASQDRGLRYQISKFILSSGVDGIIEFSEWFTKVDDSTDSVRFFGRQWVTVVSTFVTRVARLNEDSLENGEWRDISKVLLKLHALGAKVDAEVVGNVLYRAGDWAQAATWYERANKTQRPEYYICKAAISSGSEQLEWFSRAGNYTAILERKEAINAMPTAEKRACLPYLAQSYEHERNIGRLSTYMANWARSRSSRNASTR